MSLNFADQILKEVSQNTISEYKAVCADIHKAIHKVDNTIDNIDYTATLREGLMQFLEDESPEMYRIGKESQ